MLSLDAAAFAFTPPMFSAIAARRSRLLVAMLLMLLMMLPIACFSLLLRFTFTLRLRLRCIIAAAAAYYIIDTLLPYYDAVELLRHLPDC